MTEHERLNINTIAKRAGISTTAVSNFINGTETFPLAREKRERLMEVMRSFNYRPSSASSKLRRNSILPGKTVFIFGVSPESNPHNVDNNPMLNELIMALDSELKQRLNLCLEIRAVADENSIEAWNETIADAESVICYGKLDASLFDLTVRRNIPLSIIADRPVLETRRLTLASAELDAVYWDSACHLGKILDHVTERGARRLAFVSSWNIQANHPIGFAGEAEAKIAEFRRFIASRTGLTGELYCPPMPENISLHYEARNAYEFIRNKSLKHFDAIIGHNDFVAQGIVAALQEQGLRAGRDVMVGGEGDYVECRHSIPSVTTVSYDKKQLAAMVCDILARRRKENRPHGDNLLVPSRLLIRESTLKQALIQSTINV